jgi:sterol desaturase/sphingolipid hydroxylase (fatty acid hydroxylase superfamily)
MDTVIVSHEQVLRSAAFVGTLTLVAFWEAAAPRRVSTRPTAVRWIRNLALGVLSTLLPRWLFPILTVGTALLASERGWGLLNNVGVPTWLSIAVSMVVLDLIFYVEHRIFHSVPVLWRFHQVHHADLDLDLTTSLRLHPFESLAFTAINMAVVLTLGLPAAAVLAFETLVSATNLFTHGNVRLPSALDRVLRLVVVTPDMHRVHHSVLAVEGNKNFGSTLPIWDRLFNTYCAQPVASHEAMTIGLPEFRDPRSGALFRMLAHPFSRRAGGLLRS